MKYERDYINSNNNSRKYDMMRVQTRLDKPILNLGALHFWKNLSHLKVF